MIEEEEEMWKEGKEQRERILIWLIFKGITSLNIIRIIHVPAFPQTSKIEHTVEGKQKNNRVDKAKQFFISVNLNGLKVIS